MEMEGRDLQENAGMANDGSGIGGDVEESGTITKHLSFVQRPDPTVPASPYTSHLLLHLSQPG